MSVGCPPAGVKRMIAPMASRFTRPADTWLLTRPTVPTRSKAAEWLEVPLLISTESEPGRRVKPSQKKVSGSAVGTEAGMKPEAATTSKGEPRGYEKFGMRSV